MLFNEEEFKRMIAEGIADSLAEIAKKREYLTLPYVNPSPERTPLMKISKDQQLDHIMASTKTMTTTAIAREYVMTARKLNQLLESAGVHRKVNKKWELCTAHQKRGIVTISEYPFMHTNGQLDAAITMKWTQIGCLLIHDIIRNHSN